ncbi:cystinosin homolog [Convolutriloba macropyga]|uniref:cystinosin homolog n=1 Tax=Convolutriloba macropyga TaxID=536237 RepID=UPI003F522A89
MKGNWLLLIGAYFSAVFYSTAFCVVTLHVDPESHYLEGGKEGTLEIWLEGVQNSEEVFEFTINVSTNNEDVFEITDKVLVVGSIKSKVPYTTHKAGNALISFEQVSGHHDNADNGTIVSDVGDVYAHIYVIRSQPLNVFNIIVGWIYFTAWSMSFYPQLYENITRRSVVGLNFDFLSFNMLGYIVYSIFNVGLYWIPKVQDEYRDEHPGQLIPVKLNDVFFSLHGGLLTAITIGTCFIYERGNQSVSWICRVSISIGLTYILTLAIISSTDKFPNCTWWHFVSWISYIKLIVTVVKYCPQAYMNYSRQSTTGWSIGNVLLDLTGGICSLLQAFLIAYNSDDWPSLIANPVKFGLGILTIIFDAVFMVQHYILYADAHYSKSGRFLSGGGSKKGYKKIHDSEKGSSENSNFFRT